MGNREGDPARRSCKMENHLTGGLCALVAFVLPNEDDLTGKFCR